MDLLEGCQQSLLLSVNNVGVHVCQLVEGHRVVDAASSTAL
jgi:hypothetical protein